MNIEEALTEMREMLVRIEERQVAHGTRVEALEEGVTSVKGDVRALEKQVNVAHGGIAALGLIGAIIGLFKAFFSR
jgi:hypothetical protein